MQAKEIISDLTSHLKINRPFLIWMGFLSVSLLLCLYAYTIQISEGLGVTGLRDFVSWGMYISNFVFFIATSLIGMLISSVLGLIGQKWITPITRLAEIIAIGFAAVAGLVIVSDMGRPDRLLNVFIHGRFQSPILWDVTVVMTYTVISLLLWLIPMIPDLALIKNKEGLPKWQLWLYNTLSFNYQGLSEQKKIIVRSTRTLLILIIPVALAIHTVTSWLFAVTPRPGWDSTIFGPYFVSGAFVSGVSAVIIGMYIFRKLYKLKKYITDFHFNQIGKLYILVAFVYLYFNINEFLVPGYKMQKNEAHHLHELFAGSHALLFWSVQLLGLIIPMLLLILKPFRKPLPLFILGIFVLVGSWFKRYLIVVPVQEHPFLPIQNVPNEFLIYQPTLIEIAVTLGSIIMVLLIVSTLAKIFPLVPIQETIEEAEHKNSPNNE